MRQKSCVHISATRGVLGGVHAECHSRAEPSRAEFIPAGLCQATQARLLLAKDTSGCLCKARLQTHPEQGKPLLDVYLDRLLSHPAWGTQHRTLPAVFPQVFGGRAEVPLPLKGVQAGRGSVVVETPIGHPGSPPSRKWMHGRAGSSSARVLMTENLGSKRLLART